MGGWCCFFAFFTTFVFVEPAGLAHTNPSREYIRLGGRVVAIENGSVAPVEVSLTPASASLSAPAGSGSFSVVITANAPWRASTTDSWISANQTGTGPGTVTFTVQANLTGAARTGKITVSPPVGGTGFAPIDFGITQVSASVSWPPQSANVASAAGTASLTVSVDPLVQWVATVAPVDNFITVTSPAGTATGTGAVAYSYTANTASSQPRTGKIPDRAAWRGHGFAPVDLTLTQDGGTA